MARATPMNVSHVSLLPKVALEAMVTRHFHVVLTSHLYGSQSRHTISSQASSVVTLTGNKLLPINLGLARALTSDIHNSV